MLGKIPRVRIVVMWSSISYVKTTSAVGNSSCLGFGGDTTRRDRERMELFKRTLLLIRLMVEVSYVPFFVSMTLAINMNKITPPAPRII